MSVMEKRGELYDKILLTFGPDRQLVAFAEEFLELGAALLREVNGKNGDISAVILEMADAEICLEQLQRMYKNYLPLFETLKARQLERIAKKLDEMEAEAAAKKKAPEPTV